jgi:ParB/RepB/Spo0J family partition protein
MSEDALEEVETELEEAEAELVETEAEPEEIVSALDLPGAEKPPLDIREIPLDQIGERQNVRQVTDHGIHGLAETMHLEGQLHPCVVRPAKEDAAHGKPFEMIFGHRRKRAAEYLREQEVEGWETLRCEVRPVGDEDKVLQMIIENFQRENLGAVAEARAMYELKHTQEPAMSNAEVARQLGCDPSHVSHRLKLLTLAPDFKKQSPALPKAEEREDEKEEGQEGEREPEAGEDSIEPSDQPATAFVEDEPSQEEEPEAPKVDILDMVDKGDISASTAEVIASLDSREDQEKLAQLVKRYDWGVKKAANWAREVKESEVPEEGSEEMGPIEIIDMEDVTELARLRPRPDLGQDEIAKIILYALLRNGMDQEMLDYLNERMGIPYENLWHYVYSLSPEQVNEFTKRMALRYVSSAHRWFDLEPELKDELGLPEETNEAELLESAEAVKLSLPDAEEQAALPEVEEELEEQAALPEAEEDIDG